MGERSVTPRHARKGKERGKMTKDQGHTPGSLRTRNRSPRLIRISEYTNLRRSKIFRPRSRCSTDRLKLLFHSRHIVSFDEIVGACSGKSDFLARGCPNDFCSAGHYIHCLCGPRIARLDRLRHSRFNHHSRRHAVSHLHIHLGLAAHLDASIIIPYGGNRGRIRTTAS